MEYVLSAEEMKKCDERVMSEFMIPSAVLMERAALSVYNAIEEEGFDEEKTLIVCGNGNNGGDGFALARMLLLSGCEVETVLLGDKDKASAECMRQMDIFTRYGGIILTEIPEDEYTLVIDAVFGVGLSRDISGKYYDAINRLNNMTCEKIAIDIPSGVDADNGQIKGIAFNADLTVTMAFAKYGHFLYPGRDYCGDLIVADIGIDENCFDNEGPSGFYLCDDDLYDFIPAKTDSSNKGTYGRMLCICGSSGMAGAAYLCAKAGYVSGCGLGSDVKSREIVEYMLTHYDKPLVIDADALNIVAKSEKLKEALKNYPGEAYITPHIGEASRLLDTEISEIKKDPVKYAAQLSNEYNCVCILKDASTVTADIGGGIYINISGNGGMSKGGSGDVLAGLLCGLLSQGAKGKNIGAAAVYLHGAAGDLAAEKKGRYGMVATDIIDGIILKLKEIDENV